MFRPALFCARAVAAALLSLTAACATTSVDQSGHQVAWVFHRGTYFWSGDFSSNAVADYADKNGGPLNGPHDVKVSLTGKWGIFTPVAPNWDFDLKPYAYLTFAFKPTLPDQAMQVYFEQVGDKRVGRMIDPFKYGPAPEIGKWTTYRIPLQDLEVAGIRIFKIGFQDETGRARNTFYLDDIGFEAAAK